METTQTPELPGPALGAPPAPAPEPENALTHTLSLIQPWINFVPQRQRRLGLFIFLAAMAHLVVFFFIRIETVHSEFQSPDRTEVTVENPQLLDASDAEQDRFWDSLSDPRLYLLPSGPPAASGPSLNFAEINSRLSTDALPGLASGPEISFTSDTTAPLAARVLPALEPARQPFAYNETPPVAATTTAWQWDSSLAARAPNGAAALPSPVSDIELVPTMLRIEVEPTGSVQHVLLDRSCGKLELDEEAILAARKVRFAPVDSVGSSQWGMLTVAWHATPTPHEIVVPTPPSAL